MVQESETTFAVYTDLFDLDSESFEQRGMDRPDIGFSLILPNYQGDAHVDLARRYSADSTRHLYVKTCSCKKGEICLCMNRYYYLFAGDVYVSMLNRSADFHTTPPTIHEWTNLEYLPEPGSIYDRLMAQPPSVLRPPF